MPGNTNRRLVGAGLWRRGERVYIPAGGAPASLLSYASGTFSRPSEARMTGLIYPDIADAWEWKAANELRQNSDNSVILEGSRTNLLFRSEEIDNAVWNKLGATITANVVAAPDGVSDADLVSIVPGSAARRIEQAVAGTSNGQTVTLSTWIKTSDGTTKDVRLNFLLRDGATRNDSGLISVNGTWQRISWVTTTGTGANNPVYEIRGDFAGTGGDFHIWGTQLEIGSFPSSYIRTSGATAIRSADNLQFSAAASAGFAYNAPWTITYYPSFDHDQLDSTRYLMQVGAGNDVFQVIRPGSSTSFRILSSAAVAVSSGTVTFSKHQALTFSFDPTTGSLTTSGATTGNGTVVGTPWAWPAPGTSAVYVGQVNTGVAHAFGRYSEPVAV